MSDLQRSLNVIKKIKLWLLNVRIDYHDSMMDMCDREVRETLAEKQAHRLKRENLEARLTRAWYE